MYEILVAPRQRLIHSTLSGFMDVAEVRDYADHMEAAHRRWFRFHRGYRLVIDLCGARIQSQDVLAAFAAHIAAYPPAERIAVVRGPSLNRMQVLRLLDRPYLRLCDSVAEARSWALDGGLLDEASLQPVARSPAAPYAAPIACSLGIAAVR